MKENFRIKYGNTAIFDLIKKYRLKDSISIVNPDLKFLADLGGVSYHTVIGYMTGQFEIPERFIRLCRFELESLGDNLNEEREKYVERKIRRPGKRFGIT